MSNDGFPRTFPRIETKRLVLREITPDDRVDIFNNFSDPDVGRWFLDEPLSGIEQVDEFIEGFNSDFKQGKGLTWAITLKGCNACIGTCGYGVLEYGGRGEISFDLAKAYWGQGLMSESLRRVIDYGWRRLKLSRIEADTFSNNLPARRLLESLDFQLEKITEDSHYYFLTRS
jgi:ribosomal-protein-alanine N-acetyltransferase